MLKKLAFGLAALVLVIGAGLYYLSTNLDSLIKTGIEKYGSAATQTEVRVGSVSLSIKDGSGLISQLRVGNPSYFSNAEAFSFGQVSVQLDTASLTKDGPILIRSIVIKQPKVSFEVTTTGETNLNAIVKNAKAYAASNPSGKKEAAKPEPAKEGSKGRSFIIQELIVEGGEVDVSSTLLKDSKKLSAVLPQIRMTNIGKQSGGASAAEVAEQLISAISASASQVGAASVTKELNAVKDQAIDAVGSKIKGFLGK